MNLENFPTNEAAQRMLDTVSKGWYDNSYVGKWLFQIMGMEMEDAKKLYDELQQQPFPELATWGLTYHEQKYGITPLNSQDLEERRKNVIYRRDYVAPINPARLEKILEGITGAIVHIYENVQPYTFWIEFELVGNDFENQNIYEAYKEVKSIKPSHMAFMWAFWVTQAETTNKVNFIRVTNRLTIYWWRNFVSLNGEKYLNGDWSLGNPNVHPVRNFNRLEAKGGIQNEVSLIIKKHLWMIDGEFLLDGTKTLDAEIIEEGL